MEAVGLIEVMGFGCALVTADMMVKSADVVITGIEKAKGQGWETIKIMGDVSAVAAAVEVGQQISERDGKYVSSLVLPRAAEEVVSTWMQTPADKKAQEAAVEIVEVKPEAKTETVKTTKTAPKKATTKKNTTKKKTDEKVTKVTEQVTKKSKDKSKIVQPLKEQLTDKTTNTTQVKTEAVKAVIPTTEQAKTEQVDLLNSSKDEPIKKVTSKIKTEEKIVTPEKTSVTVEEKNSAPTKQIKAENEKTSTAKSSQLEEQSSDIKNKVMEVQSAKAETYTCNICKDPLCSRHKGEPRKACIHYEEFKKINNYFGGKQL